MYWKATGVLQKEVNGQSVVFLTSAFARSFLINSWAELGGKECLNERKNSGKFFFIIFPFFPFFCPTSRSKGGGRHYCSVISPCLVYSSNWMTNKMCFFAEMFFVSSSATEGGQSISLWLPLGKKKEKFTVMTTFLFSSSFFTYFFCSFKCNKCI